MSNLKTCPNCGKRFWTTEGYRFCFRVPQATARGHPSQRLPDSPAATPAADAAGRTRCRPMSRTKKGTKGPGYEYWSRRPAKGCVDPGKSNKTITHRLERAAAKRKLNEEK